MLVSKDIQQQIESVDPWLALIPVAKIATMEEYQIVLDRTKEVKAKAKEIEALRTSITGPINSALDNINDMFRGPSGKLKQYEAGLKSMLEAFDREQENIRIKKQQELDEAARIQREALQKEAAKAEEKGDINTAEAVRMQAATVASPAVIKPTAVKGSGVSFRMKWECTVKDKRAFVDWCVKNDQLGYLTVSEALLSKEAQNVQGEKAWPGITITNRRVTSVGA